MYKFARMTEISVECDNPECGKEHPQWLDKAKGIGNTEYKILEVHRDGDWSTIQHFCIGCASCKAVDALRESWGDDFVENKVSTYASIGQSNLRVSRVREVTEKFMHEVITLDENITVGSLTRNPFKIPECATGPLAEVEAVEEEEEVVVRDVDGAASEIFKVLSKAATDYTPTGFPDAEFEKMKELIRAGWRAFPMRMGGMPDELGECIKVSQPVMYGRDVIHFEVKYSSFCTIRECDITGVLKMEAVRDGRVGLRHLAKQN